MVFLMTIIHFAYQYILIKYVDFSQTIASKCTVTMLFHNYGHNS